MPLLSFEEVRPWAEAIKEEVLARSMPPWFAAAGFEGLVGENVLSPRELDILADWTSGGAPAGERQSASSGALLPPPPPEKVERPTQEAEELEELTYSARAGAGAIGPEGLPELQAAFSWPLALPLDRYLAGWGVEPEGDRSLKSALLRLDGTPLGSWVAGEEAPRWPAGMGFYLTAGSTLRLEVAWGKGQARRHGATAAAARAAGPAGAGAALHLHLRLHRRQPPLEVEAVPLTLPSLTLPAGTILLGLLPEAGAAPGRLQATSRQGTPRTLLELSSAPPAWPITYRFRAPVALSPETALEWTPLGPPGAGPRLRALSLFHARPRR